MMTRYSCNTVPKPNRKLAINSEADGPPWKYIPASNRRHITPRLSIGPGDSRFKQADRIDPAYGGEQGAKYNWIPTKIPNDAQDAVANTRITFRYVTPFRILWLMLLKSA